jgi:hypothetical protein
MADDRLLWRRSESIAVSKADNVKRRRAAIFFSDPQNASSTLTLVVRPSITTERFTIRDFMDTPDVVTARHRNSKFVAHHDLSEKSLSSCQNHTAASTFRTPADGPAVFAHACKLGLNEGHRVKEERFELSFGSLATLD